MALPIAPTPTLSGKDAQAFIDNFNRTKRTPPPIDSNAQKIRENIMRVRREQKQF